MAHASKAVQTLKHLQTSAYYVLILDTLVKNNRININLIPKKIYLFHYVRHFTYLWYIMLIY